MNDNVKVLFKYESDVLDEITVETMWAKVVDKEQGIFQLDSIPFYGIQIAPGDLFHATFDDTEKMLTYRYVVEYSENSVVLVSINDSNIEIKKLREEFQKMNCLSEGVNDSYFSMEIPRSVNYAPIKFILEKMEVSDTIFYAEPCLSDKHKNDLK